MKRTAIIMVLAIALANFGLISKTLADKSFNIRSPRGNRVTLVITQPDTEKYQDLPSGLLQRWRDFFHHSSANCPLGFISLTLRQLPRGLHRSAE